MENIYHYVGFVIVWAAILIALIFTIIFVSGLVYYKVWKRTWLNYLIEYTLFIKYSNKLISTPNETLLRAYQHIKAKMDTSSKGKYIFWRKKIYQRLALLEQVYAKWLFETHGEVYIPTNKK